MRLTGRLNKHDVCIAIRRVNIRNKKSSLYDNTLMAFKRFSVYRQIQPLLIDILGVRVFLFYSENVGSRYGIECFQLEKAWEGICSCYQGNMSATE